MTTIIRSPLVTPIPTCKTRVEFQIVKKFSALRSKSLELFSPCSCAAEGTDFQEDAAHVARLVAETTRTGTGARQTQEGLPELVRFTIFPEHRTSLGLVQNPFKMTSHFEVVRAKMGDKRCRDSKRRNHSLVAPASGPAHTGRVMRGNAKNGNFSIVCTAALCVNTILGNNCFHLLHCVTQTLRDALHHASCVDGDQRHKMGKALTILWGGFDLSQTEILGAPNLFVQRKRWLDILRKLAGVLIFLAF